jgi:Na+-translocating ferredoxin:NAD+ oxidoreductase RnfD subunit
MKNLLKSLLAEDKLKHIVVSAIIAVVLNLFLPWLAAAGITFAIGVGKEVYDMVSGKGCSEWKDLLADLVGILIGIL